MKVLLLTTIITVVSMSVDRKLETTIKNQKEDPKPERKAYFTPYYNLQDNDEAFAPGDKIPQPKPEN